MKKIIALFILTLIFSTFASQARDLKAYLFYCTFLSLEDGPFIETYISVDGKSVTFIEAENGKFQGTLEITMIFKLDGEIKDFKKYDLLSPDISDTTNINFHFIDQQRFLLPNGLYDFEILIADKNKETLPFVITRPVNIDFPYDEVSISGIELIESFSKAEKTGVLTKSGYDLVPYVSNFFSQTQNKLTYYSEIYNTEIILGKDEKFLVTSYIESYETEKPMPKFIEYKKVVTQPVNVLFNEFDISDLPSGNYSLVIEVRDRENNQLAYNSLFFQRSNPSIKINVQDIAAININNTFAERIGSADTLAEHIRSLDPISSQLERAFTQNLAKAPDLRTMQQYFYNFWYTRDNLDPEGSWLKYAEQLKIADASFGTGMKKGYDTDRGRVFLKYGPPNAISESYNEPNAFPYEIWHFYELSNQRNRRFVFYSRELATNDFELVHSDAVGEISNYQWQFVIHGREFAPVGIDDQIVPNHWGSRINDYYITPR